MSRIHLILMGAALCGCGTHRPRPIVPDPIRETIALPTTVSPVDRPPAPSESAVSRMPVPPPSTKVPTVEAHRDVSAVLMELNSQLVDAFFDYDRAELRADAIAALRQDAAILLPILAEFPQVKLTIEGHCDERGSAEYNLGLGNHRAERAAELLKRFGVPKVNSEIVSFGKEAPQCNQPRESCWRLNRRAHLVVRSSAPTG